MITQNNPGTMMQNKSTVFCIMRHDFSGTDVVCCVATESEKADELVGEYTQMFLDKGFKPEEFYFYAVATTLYTR